MIPYPHYAIPNLYIVCGYSLEESEYGKLVSYLDEDALEGCVRKILVRIPKTINGRQLRFLRRGLDLSQEAFGTLIDRDGQTVARLEKLDAPVPQMVDLAIRTRYFGRYEPSVSIGEILSIHDGLTRFPKEKILLSYKDNKWTYAFDIPKLIIEYTQEQLSGAECLIDDVADGGHIYQRRLRLEIIETDVLNDAIDGQKDNRMPLSHSYRKLEI